MKNRFLFVVAAALIDTDGHVLLAQRPDHKDLAGLWEFPGGKVEQGETPEAALIRELQEELDIAVEYKDLVPLTFASHMYENFQLFMPLYLCRHWQGTMTPSVHKAIRWVSLSDLNQTDYPMPEADIPLISFLSFWLKEIRQRQMIS